MGLPIEPHVLLELRGQTQRLIDYLSRQVHRRGNQVNAAFCTDMSVEFRESVVLELCRGILCDTPSGDVSMAVCCLPAAMKEAIFQDMETLADEPDELRRRARIDAMFAHLLEVAIAMRHEIYKAGTEVEAESKSAPSVSEVDVQVLRTIASNKGVLITQIELAGILHHSRNTIRDSLDRLEARHFASQPRGKRQGWAITESGLSLLRRLKALPVGITETTN